MTIQSLLREAGYRTADSTYYRYIDLWEQWYAGDVRGFHDYKVFNGDSYVPQKRAQLNMAKQSCEYWAGLLWNSDCYITLDGGQQQEKLEEILRRVDFTRQTNNLTEKAFAMGTGAYLAYPDEHGKTRVEYLSAPHIFPLDWVGDDCVSCAFASRRNSGAGDDNLYLAAHEKTKDGWLVRNYRYIMENGKAKSVALPDGVQEEYRTPVKLFSLIRPNIANNIANTPLGVSVYANAIDVLKQIDLAFDGAKVSLQIGRPRVAVVGEVMKLTPFGEQSVFDPNDICFYQFPTIENLQEKKIIQDITTEYRANDFEESLQNALSLYAQQIGLGDKAFTWDRQRHMVQTATQVIAENATMLRCMEKHQEGLRSAITDIVRALLHLEGVAYDKAITIKFDDSTTRDRDAERMRAMQWVTAGLFPFWRYLVEYEGYGEGEAREVEAQAAASTPMQYGHAVS